MHSSGIKIIIINKIIVSFDDRPMMEIIHWMRNDKEAPNPILILLLGTRDGNSSLSLLRGLEDVILKNIASWSVSPCHCCCRDGPVAFCCRRQKKMLIDKNKAPRLAATMSDGEVPDVLFCQEKVLLYVEGLPPYWGYGGHCTSSLACSGKMHSSEHGYLALTNRGFHHDEYNAHFEWDNSAHVIVSTTKYPGSLTIEFIKDHRDKDDAYDVSWHGTVIRTPRILEIVQLMQEKRRLVMASTAYKEILELSTEYRLL